MTSPEKIIIIGNGFDLNLGLKTSYNDFIKSDNFKNLLLNNNLLAKYLHERQALEHWVDIENELKDYSHINNEHLRSDFEEISEELVKYLEGIDTSTVKKDSDAYSLLKNNCNDNILILDFNYTDSVEKVLLSCGVSKDELPNKLKKIHGSLKDKDIIFGVEDRSGIKDEHTFLEKSSNQKYKAINVSSLVKDANEVIIFGHSLGETDHQNFRKFFEGQTNMSDDSTKKIIHLYHYKKEGADRLMMQIKRLAFNNRVHELRMHTDIRYTETYVAK